MAVLPPSFEELINGSDLPVLVDFYADWCAPCKMVSPVIAQLAKEYKGRMVTVKINTEKKQDVARRYAIQSIPTIMLFHRGKQLMRLQGAHPYESLKSELERALPN
ncbi:MULTISPECIES: thioredoxin [unclassified Oceanispirochaeta]|uniref:thioredoxin n=1 Tax=unclassified Oceanispirochaeta TaxID=2635722 RepID=UPI000E093484|nr:MULTISPECIES: thioredoxin [unclassified Oceanispirochaeta]MBF9014982.1 thioredoxin [Oceanispirochaeta sp. M2]NPD71337.1 thioredoxin [Oceanispirochaeta sp. M1]RDG33303.1 thioredoxin [Oceanispirochaeta sp. M1]